VTHKINYHTWFPIPKKKKVQKIAVVVALYKIIQ
jgi:hypothetical protein